MALIHHDYMVDQITAAVANPALGDSVLPRTSEAGPFGLDAEALHCIDHLLIEVCCTVEDQVTGERIVWNGLTELLDPSRAGRVFGDATAQDSAPIMRDHEEAVQHAKGQRRHGKEVPRSNGFTVIAQKRRPSLCRLRRPWRHPHPAQHGPLGNVEAEHPQSAMNAWRTPRWVFGNHAEGEFMQFNADAPPARPSSMPRKPLPIQLESSPVPAYNCLRLDENQHLLQSDELLPQS
jgi:hypothetical protein